MQNYFSGWYYRCQSDTQTLAIIPSIYKTKGDAFCNIQAKMASPFWDWKPKTMLLSMNTEGVPWYSLSAFIDAIA